MSSEIDRLPFRAASASSAYTEIDELPVVILLENVRSLYNVGAFFRTADAAGARGLILGGITGHPPQPMISKTALGAEETVRWTHTWAPAEAITELRDSGHEIAAIETSPHAVDLFDWQPRFPVCIMFGHEADGLTPETAALADVHIRIPMLGRKHSLNVATSGGVVLYELLRKFRALQRRAPGA